MSDCTPDYWQTVRRLLDAAPAAAPEPPEPLPRHYLCAGCGAVASADGAEPLPPGWRRLPHPVYRALEQPHCAECVARRDAGVVVTDDDGEP